MPAEAHSVHGLNEPLDLRIVIDTIPGLVWNFSADGSWLYRQPLATEPKSPRDLSERLAAQETEMIEAALRGCAGRVFGPSGAAAKLGMPRSTLESKIRSLKIDKNRFRTAVPSENT
jgi:DNA-binding NtrC family response regulator